MTWMKRIAVRVISAVLVIAVVVGGFIGAQKFGWLEAFGIESESSDSQIIEAIERTQEISLVSLSVQGVKQQKDSGTIFGWDVPGTSEKVVLIYRFKAKLGLDGSKVKVTRSGEHAYRVEVPAFVGIGFDSPTFEVASEDGSILSGFTPDIDRVEMVNEILSDKNKKSYLTLNRDALEAQTQVFFDGLIRSIDPDATTTYSFK